MVVLRSVSARLVLIILGGVFAAFGLGASSVKAANKSELQVEILPLECLFDIVDTGTNEIVYLTPDACGHPLPQAPPNENPVTIPIPTGDISITPAEGNDDAPDTGPFGATEDTPAPLPDIRLGEIRWSGGLTGDQTFYVSIMAHAILLLLVVLADVLSVGTIFARMFSYVRNLLFG